MLTLICANCKNPTIPCDLDETREVDVVTCTSCNCCYHIDVQMAKVGVRLLTEGFTPPQPVCQGHWGIELDLNDEQQKTQALCCVLRHVMPEATQSSMRWVKEKCAVMAQIADNYMKKPAFLHIDALIGVANTLADQTHQLIHTLGRAEEVMESDNLGPLHPDWPKAKASMAMAEAMQNMFQQADSLKEDRERQERDDRRRQIEMN